MAHSYATPSAFKTALEARIRKRAEASGDDIGRVRQLAVYERFLARLIVQFGGRLVVKGGLALQLRIQEARTTRDLDLRMVGEPNRVLHELRRAGQLALNEDFLVFEVEPDPNHPTIEGEGVVYGGRRFRVKATLAGKVYGSTFGVDVGFGDRMAAAPELVSGTDLFEFAGIPRISVHVYAREVHVAEKLHALTLPRERENTRVKDLPDLALLATTGPFDSVVLRVAIQATFSQRGVHEPPSSIDAPPESWAQRYAAMAIENELRWATLTEVHAAVRAFLDPVLGGDDGVWSPERWSWEPRP